MTPQCAIPGDAAAFALAVPLLARVFKARDADDLAAQYADGRAQLWLALDGGKARAVCVTQSAGETLHFWLCAGDGCDWRAMMTHIAGAGAGRFRRMTIEGRKGWARLLGFAVRPDGVMERAL